jgi:hypothetical protein
VGPRENAPMDSAERRRRAPSFLLFPLFVGRGTPLRTGTAGTLRSITTFVKWAQSRLRVSFITTLRRGRSYLPGTGTLGCCGGPDQCRVRVRSATATATPTASQGGRMKKAAAASANPVGSAPRPHSRRLSAATDNGRPAPSVVGRPFLQGCAVLCRTSAAKVTALLTTPTFESPRSHELL